MLHDRDLESLRKKIDKLEKENAHLRREFIRINNERIEYLQNVSHQLVSPLNAIKWHIENLTERRIGIERAKKVLRSIYSQSTIAVHLAKNFALMSSLEADHALSSLKEPLQSVSLCALMINLADDFQPQGWDKDIKVEVKDKKDHFESAPAVLVMKPLISQALSNIMENAVKYSVRGATVEVTGWHDGGDGTVSVSVASKGIPLTEEAQSRVFERGYRSDEAKNQYPAGTGFGLYIARRIVEIHEGTISVNTDDLGRAVFTMTLSVRGLEGKARTRDPKNSSPYR